MEMFKKILLTTVILGTITTRVFAAQNNQNPNEGTNGLPEVVNVVPSDKTEDQNEQEKHGFFEENKTVVATCIAVAAVVTAGFGGYFGYKYFGKDLYQKLFAKKTAPAKKATSLEVIKEKLEDTKNFVKKLIAKMPTNTKGCQELPITN